MSHSLATIWIHTFFGTKNECSAIDTQCAQELFAHMRSYLEQEIHCNKPLINGMHDHVHLLFLLSTQYPLQDVLQRLKGESSHWMNQQHAFTQPFAWQTGYGACSVSPAEVRRVSSSILHQQQVHEHMTFAQEFAALMAAQDYFPQNDVRTP
jgi:putative transposase